MAIRVMELSADSSDAVFTVTLHAAERYICELKLTSEAGKKNALNENCQSLLEETERIKAAQREGNRSIKTTMLCAMPDIGSTPKEPLSMRALSTREQITLLEGSKLHGCIFPPWTKLPSAMEFEPQAGEPLYQDYAELCLSDAQQTIFNGWQRPDRAFPSPSVQQPDVFPELGPTMITHGTMDLVQDVTADCSVVASLCAITARAERGHSEIMVSIIYPYDYNTMRPIISSNGKYVFRFNFNGCFRKVVIDDRLPTSRTEQTLHVVDRNNPGVIWPALIEKAYLKVRGGYDFPGSNSGTDICVLTGWIPEQLFLQSDGTLPNALWRRVFTAFGYGDVLITVGTGKLTEREEDDTGLIGQHDYTIIDMKEIEGKRLLLVKNPWSGGTTWKGRLNYDGCSTNDGLTKDEQKYKPENCGSSISERLAPGTFWMDLNDIFQNFDTMYLNWNPGLFPFREDIHFTWDLASSRSATGSFAHNPQFRLQSRHGGTAWLLLSRYFMNTNQVSLSHTSGSLPTPGASHGFISLYAFDNNGERVIIDEGAFVRAPYVDSPNTLIKLELLPSKSYTIVVSELEISALRYSFSLSAFALHPISIRKARNKYNYFLSKPGVWTLSSSGGNASGASYHKNPQFSIKVPITSDICLLLETSNEQFPVHIKLVWGGGKALSSITTRDIVCDSGKYRQGCAVAEMSNVQAGAYTIVCSTFDQGQLGKFNLHLSSTSDCTVDRILSAEAGRLVLSAPTALFSSGRDRLLVPLIPLRITRVSLMTRVPHERLASAKRFNSLLKVSIEHGQGPSKRVLAVSGNDEFLDNRSGIQTKEVDVDPNMCSHRGLWIVLERLGGLESPNDEVNVEILSDEPIELGAWGEGNG